ncbi:hypothetical protein BC827DRAFT_1381996, partial [Russula dissimulans]
METSKQAPRNRKIPHGLTIMCYYVEWSEMRKRRLFRHVRWRDIPYRKEEKMRNTVLSSLVLTIDGLCGSQYAEVTDLTVFPFGAYGHRSPLWLVKFLNVLELEPENTVTQGLHTPRGRELHKRRKENVEISEPPLGVRKPHLVAGEGRSMLVMSTLSIANTSCEMLEVKESEPILPWDQLREKLRTWLSPPDHSTNHNAARETQHRVTANWFIQGNTFRDWKKNGSLLWIRGNPGVGKSILCSAIIEDIKGMREATEALIAYYYFDFKDASKRNLRGLLASLLFQLGDDSDSCWNILYQLYTECRGGSEKPSVVALTKCLQTMISLPGQVPVFIILDALDECPSATGTPSAREEVMDFLEDLVGSGHSNLFVCITSRPEQDIQSILNPLTPTSRRVSLHEEDGQREDIKSFVRSFVHGDRAMRRWREEDRELVINTLSQRANGMFRW